MAACTNNKARIEEEKLRQDSIRMANEARVRDSLATLELQKENQRMEISKTAFGGARFEMGAKEVLETEVFRGGTSGADWVQPRGGSSPVGRYQYGVRAKFHHDSLYMITFTSGSENAAYIEDKILSYATNFKEVIAEKYGPPQKNNGAPDVMDFNPGSIRWIYEWDIEDKVIQIGMAEESSGSHYYAVSRIYYKPIFQKLFDAKGNRKQDSVIRDATKF